MGEFETVLKAIREAHGTSLASRFASSAPKVGNVASALTVPERAPQGGGGYSRIDLKPFLPSNSDLGAAELFMPRRQKNEAELFSGPFMQLGTYLGIENEGLRFLVDVVFDPINLVLPGSGLLLNSVGKIARVTSAAVRASKVAGTTVKTIGEAFEGVEKIIKLAGQGEKYLGELKAAAANKVPFFGKRGFRKLIDKGLATAPSAEAKQVLGALRNSREALLALDKLAVKVGGAEIGEKLLLKNTLRGRILAGQVNPLLRIERPFARTRRLLTHTGVLPENSFLGVARGDYILWNPISSGLAAGGGKVGDAIAGLTAGGKLTDAVARGLGERGNAVPAAEAAFRAVDGATARAAHNAKVIEARLAAHLGDLSGGADIGLDLIEDEAVIGLLDKIGITGVKPGDPDIGAYREFLQAAVFKGEALNDISAIRRSTQLAQNLVDQASSNVGEFAGRAGLESDEIEQLVLAEESYIRRLIDERSPEALLRDPNGVRGFVESQKSTANLLLNQLRASLGDVFEGAFRGTNGGRAHTRLFREAAALPIEMPEMFVRGSDGILRLADDATIAKNIEKGFASEKKSRRVGHTYEFLTDLLERAQKSEGVDMRGLLQTHGFFGGMTDAVDSMRRMDQIMLAQADRFGLHEQFVENHFRRLIRPKGDPRVARGADVLGIDIGKASNVDESAERLIENIRKEAAPLKRGKGKESVQKLRRASALELLTLEKRGALKIERDSLSRLIDGIEGNYRAALARQLVDDWHVNKPLWTRDQMRLAFAANDVQSLGTRLLHKVSGESTIPKLNEAVLGRGGHAQLATDIAETTEEGVKIIPPWERARELGYARELSEGEFFQIYDEVKVTGGVDRIITDLQNIERSALRGVASNLDDPLLKRSARDSLFDDLKKNKELQEKIFGEAGLKTRGGKDISDDLLKKVVNGERLPKSIKRPAAVRKAVAKEFAERVKSGAELIASRASPRAASAKKVYVLKPMSGTLKESLHLFEKGGITAPGPWGSMRRAGFKLKALKLNQSVFHYNVISFAGELLNPAKTVALLRHPIAKEYRAQALAKAGLGGVVGAAGGGVLSDDEEGVLFGGLMGLFYGSAIGAAISQSKAAAKFAFSPEFMPYYARMGFAGWAGRPNDRSIGFIARTLQDFADGLKATHGKTIITNFIDGAVGVQMSFERNMWDLAHNGHKTAGFTFLAQENTEKLIRDGLKPGTEAFIRAERTLDRESMNVINSAFGGFQAARLWNDPRWQEAAKGVLLAPDWTIGNLLGAANIFLNQSIAQSAATGAAVGTLGELAAVGFNPDEFTGMGTLGGAAIGTTLRTMGSRAMSRIMAPGSVARAQSMRLYRNALLGGYFFMNLINKMNTGHYMWDNPESKRLSMSLPGGKSYVTLGKAYTEVLGFMSAEGGRFPIPGVSRIASKLAPIPKLAVEIFSNNGPFGPIIRLHDGDTAGTALFDGAAYALDSIAPIVVSRPLRGVASVLKGSANSPADALIGGLISTAGFSVSQGKANAGRLESFLQSGTGARQVPFGFSEVGSQF